MPLWKVTMFRRQRGTATVEADDATDAGLFTDPAAFTWETVDSEITDIASVEDWDVPDTPPEGQS
jgi:hypothetical protein